MHLLDLYLESYEWHCILLKRKMYILYIIESVQVGQMATSMSHHGEIITDKAKEELVDNYYWNTYVKLIFR